MKPGIVDGLDAKLYHADPALSNSGAKLLLPPSTPAHYRWAMDHPQPPKDEFDVGTIAHRLALEGHEDDVAVLDFPDRRTNDYRAAAKAARENGQIPILEKDMAEIRAMVAQLRQHPLASALLSNGKAEQSAFWNDPQTGAPLRARFDWLPEVNARGRFILSDYKTAKCAAPREFGDSAARYRYHMQRAFYTAAASVLLGIDDPAFLFIVQEKDAPYAVNVIELDSEAERMGRELMRRAIDLYAHCTETGNWPGYQGVASAVLPVWATYEHQEIFDAA
jgi:hypothetical protein